MENERLTWEQIKERYPYQIVGLVDVETEKSEVIKSAIVKFTSKNMSYEEFRNHITGPAIKIIYTAKDVEEIDGILYRCRQSKEDKEKMGANKERLTWSQIKAKYPYQNVGLMDIECGINSISVESAIVKYTDNDTSYEELCMRTFAGEIQMMYTTSEEEELEGILGKLWWVKDE